MKTIVRNFLSVIRRFKFAAVLNLLGLSIAFTSFTVIMMQVDFDNRFDSFHPDVDKIFRVDLVQPSGSLAIMSRPFARAITESSPHIKAGMIQQSWNINWFFFVEQGGKRKGFKETYSVVTPEMLQIFRLDMVEGTDQALAEPNSAIISESMAQRLFGEESAMHKQLLSPNKQSTPVTVKGVYKDLPLNSSLQNYIYLSMDPKLDFDEWGNQNYYLIVRLDDAANKGNVVENFKHVFDTKQFGSSYGDNFQWGKDGLDLQLVPLTDLHYMQNVTFDSMPKASKQTTMVLFTIAFVILIIAMINFTNFSTALTPMRVKSINTQKVLGSSGAKLRVGLIIEAIGVSLLAYLISIELLSILAQTPLVTLVDADMSLSNQTGAILRTGVLAVLIGLLGGLYPACYITSFPPALVLKGNFGLSPKGRRLRSFLVGIQFVASFALIIAAIFMFLQNYFMQHAPLGYDKDEVVVVGMNSELKKNRDTFAGQLKNFAGIDDVTFAESLLSSGDSYMGWGREYKGKSINMKCIPVSANFLKVMGVKVESGRDFRPEDEQKEAGSFIFNEKARAEYGIELNDKIEGSEVIGFMPDVKFASFRTEVAPMAFYVWGKYIWGKEQDPYYTTAYIKLKAGSDSRAAMGHIRETLSGIDSEYPFTVRFYDEILQQTYEKEQKISSLITMFSLVAIFISIVGVFGLVVFDSEYRRKEIGIRKVLGSTTGQVLLMFNRSYLAILTVCFLLGAPVAWYGVNRWLENFAYRTPMYWWVFLLSLVIVGVITFITVTFQNWHVANENPVNNVKNE